MHIYQVLENGVPRFRGTKKQCQDFQKCLGGDSKIEFYKYIDYSEMIY